MPRSTREAGIVQIDRVIAVLAGLVIVGLGVFLLVRNQPIADPRLFFSLRVLLSFTAAVLGATIPGFLLVNWSGGGLVVRAGGALALFALTYLYTPDLVDPQPIQSFNAAGGVAAQQINQSPIVIGSPPQTQPHQ